LPAESINQERKVLTSATVALGVKSSSCASSDDDDIDVSVKSARAPKWRIAEVRIGRHLFYLYPENLCDRFYKNAEIE
jgi:hypothetical protein